MAVFSVFTKPWSKLPTAELIRVVNGLGFGAIEFPLRDGSQVSPDEAEGKLPGFVRELGDAGITIDSVASSPIERVFAACAECGIPLIRVMFSPPPLAEFVGEEAAYLKTLDSYIPLCERYGVKVGLQMHCGRGASTTADMMRVVSKFDAEHIGAIWDAAHSGLAGEECEQAIDTAWSHLCLVNFKNAYYKLEGRGMDRAAIFRPHFCAGADGQCPWPRAAAHLAKKGYSGTWCMPAEYDGVSREDELLYLERDYRWLRELVEGGHGR